VAEELKIMASTRSYDTGGWYWPGVTRATKRVMEASGFSVEWVECRRGDGAGLGMDNVDAASGRWLAAIRAHKGRQGTVVTTPVGRGQERERAVRPKELRL